MQPAIYARTGRFHADFETPKASACRLAQHLILHLSDISLAHAGIMWVRTCCLVGLVML